jgi:hypothetical protein
MMYLTNDNQNTAQKRKLRFLEFAVLIFTMLWGSALAQTSKLIVTDAEANDSFGYSLAVSANTLLIGAWQNDSVHSNSGAAYVFELDSGRNWHQAIKLTPDDADFAGDEFGRAVAIDGDWLIVGAQFDDSANKDFGAAYIFERTPDADTAWSMVSLLTANDGAFHDYFGQTVAISGTVAVVGAPEDDDLGRESGSVYIFERSSSDGSWIQVAKLTASDGEGNDLFGSAVAIAGDTVIIGASGHSHQDVNNTGAAYVFVRQPDGSWNETAKLTASDSDELDQFGFAVALHGNRALIGAPFDDDSMNIGGSAYFFERVEGSNTWNQIGKLTASDPKLGNQFGHSVALTGGQALIGSPGNDERDKQSGAAYLFHYDSSLGSWSQQTKLTASDGAMDDLFGFAVSLSDKLAFISMHEDDDGDKKGSGSAYIFEVGF